MGNECDNLDAFLLGDLGRDEAARFEQHLATCAACRGAVDQQRWLDGLLRSPERADLEPPPDSLVGSVDHRIGRLRRRRRLVAGGLAAAAALVVAAGWTVWAGRQARNPPAGQIAQSGNAVTNRQGAGGSPAAQPQPPNRSTEAVVVGGKNTIAVPVESHYPNVTVVRMYPAYQPEYAVQATTSRPEAVDDFARPDHINGG